MLMPTDREVQRLKKVYEGYMADPHKQAQWNIENQGNRAIFWERQLAIDQVLQQHHLELLDEKRILEIGCGSGNVLAGFIAWGAKPDHLYGVDLLPERIESAKKRYPDFQFECANAEQLNFPDGMFDLVLFFTVFSSLLDRPMRSRVADEATRVLKRGGVILWYDIRYNNPVNPHVRGVTKDDIQQLFRASIISLKTITLLPPFARRLGALTSLLYPILSRIPVLRTHYLCLLLKS